MSAVMWLITIEMREARINRRRTIVWKQTILTTQEPDAYVGDRHGKQYFVGEEGESHVEMVLLFAMPADPTPERMALLDGAEAVVGSMTQTEYWS